MRVMPIRVFTGSAGLPQLKASFAKNWKHYLQEALGLAVFMISACFFGSMLEAKDSFLHETIPHDFLRTVIMGVLMGLTALFIFYSPWTSPSGSQINPAVTLAFWRLGKMCHWDAFFYILFQFAGGTLAVYIMQLLLGNSLTDAPVHSVVTIPGKAGTGAALVMELIISFTTMSMVLFSSHQAKLKSYTRLFSGILVCCWVILAGPVSGFGMNPARSFASAWPAGTWTAFPVYLFAPVAGMLLATECYLLVQHKKLRFMKRPSRTLTIILLISLFQLSVHGQVKKVDAIGITVSEMDRSVKFYSEVLGFKKISDTEVYGTAYEQLHGLFGLRMRIVRMQLGEEFIELTDYLTSGGRNIPEDAKSNDLIFQHIAIVVSDMDKAYQQLRNKMVNHVSTGPQTIPVSNAAAAGVKAFYFQDPDRHNLELIWFPPGKGQPKWQLPKGKLFLGVDHTAIGVSSTEKSLHFYEQLLGIARQGDSWNSGTEQAHLNYVENASLHITGLRTGEGPGIEFLQYLVPGPGKTYPADSKTDDIWHWQTTLVVPDAESLYKQLSSAGYRFISKQLTDLRDKNGTGEKAFLVRDPDGHAMLIRSMNE